MGCCTIVQALQPQATKPKKIGPQNLNQFKSGDSGATYSVITLHTI
jgi:hypothetical protein